jgi:hypothetical protein
MDPRKVRFLSPQRTWSQRSGPQGPAAFSIAAAKEFSGILQENSPQYSMDWVKGKS